MKAQIDDMFALSVSARLPRFSAPVLTGVIVAILIIGYLALSQARHVANPDDKLMPSITQFANAFVRAISPDRNGERPLLIDTIASLRRFGIGVVAGAIVAILGGLTMGLFPIAEALLLNILKFFSKIPPVALMPIIFIFLGLGETSKVFLIFVGFFPPVLLAVYLRTKAIPREQIVKTLTLGGSKCETMRIALTQVMPYALNTIRINMLSAWLFLLVAEAIAADSGLGYRIFLVRRYLAMDTIIIYVLWIAILSFLLDMALTRWVHRQYRWNRE